MTMAHERTRALIWAREFLQDCRAGKLTPEEQRHQANVILRHYPDLRELDHLAVASESDLGDLMARIDFKTGTAIDPYATPPAEPAKILTAADVLAQAKEKGEG